MSYETKPGVDALLAAHDRERFPEWYAAQATQALAPAALAERLEAPAMLDVRPEAPAI